MQPTTTPESTNNDTAHAESQPNLTTTAQPSPSVEPVTPKKSLPKIVKIMLIVFIAILGFVIIFIVVVSVLVNRSTADAVKVSNQIVDKIQANDASGIYALAVDDFKQNTPENQLSTLVNSISPELQGVEKIITRKIEKRDNKTFASIVYEVPTSSGSKYIRVVLSKTDNWKVLNFRASETRLEADIE